MERRITVNLKIGDRSVELSGPEDFVREEVRHLTATLARQENGSEQATPRVERQQLGSATTEAELIQEKQPANHSETVAVLAYALRSAGVSEFTEEDMTRAYKRARFKPPKVVGQAIRDAKNTFDYIESGEQRGKYKLSHHGERTVEFDLPRKG